MPDLTAFFCRAMAAYGPSLSQLLSTLPDGAQPVCRGSAPSASNRNIGPVDVTHYKSRIQGWRLHGRVTTKRTVQDRPIRGKRV